MYTDIILASKNSIFCIPASRLNIKIPKNHILFLKKKMSENFFKDIILSSRKFSAKEAYNQNLINAYINEKDLNVFSEKYIENIINKDRKINSFYLKLLKN